MPVGGWQMVDFELLIRQNSGFKIFRGQAALTYDTMIIWPEAMRGLQQRHAESYPIRPHMRTAPRSVACEWRFSLCHFDEIHEAMKCCLVLNKDGERKKMRIHLKPGRQTGIMCSLNTTSRVNLRKNFCVKIIKSLVNLTLTLKSPSPGLWHTNITMKNGSVWNGLLRLINLAIRCND